MISEKMTLKFLRMMLSLIYQQMKLVVAAGKFGQKQKETVV